MHACILVGILFLCAIQMEINVVRMVLQPLMKPTRGACDSIRGLY